MEYEADFENADNFYEKKGSDFYYMLNLPKEVERIKIDRPMTITAVIVPYVSTASPYTAPGRLWFSRDYYQYKGLGPDKKSRCFDNIRTFGDTRCAIADAMAGLEGGLRRKSQRMALFNMYVVEIDDTEVNKLMLLDFSFANFAEVFNTERTNLSKRRGMEFVKDYLHYEKGCYITWTFTEHTFEKAKFYKAQTFTFAPHGGMGGKIKQLIPNAVDLDAALNRLSYEEVKARFVDCFVPEQNTTTQEEAPIIESAPTAASVVESKPVSTQTVDVSSETLKAAKAAATSDAPFDDEGW